eukprot:TRINITY_DN103550_c0_g1_i1.p2 TRINITY_DN103550_c0_g1~~TRINITY_DN103550_c0_g1_i1.p2  ORF type:complete len:112 (+),score=7.39 TRINITY_DN103550_c0_g1_i1:41-376(+)
MKFDMIILPSIELAKLYLAASLRACHACMMRACAQTHNYSYHTMPVFSLPSQAPGCISLSSVPPAGTTFTYSSFQRIHVHVCRTSPSCLQLSFFSCGADTVFLPSETCSKR